MPTCNRCSRHIGGGGGGLNLGSSRHRADSDGLCLSQRRSQGASPLAAGGPGICMQPLPCWQRVHNIRIHLAGPHAASAWSMHASMHACTTRRQTHRLPGISQECVRCQPPSCQRPPACPQGPAQSRRRRLQRDGTAVQLGSACHGAGAQVQRCRGAEVHVPHASLRGAVQPRQTVARSGSMLT